MTGRPSNRKPQPRRQAAPRPAPRGRPATNRPANPPAPKHRNHAKRGRR